MKNIKFYLCITLILPLILSSQLSYSATGTRYSGSGGSFTININSNSVLSNTPSLGSDSNNYYLISPSNQQGIIVNEASSQPSGTVNCTANYLQGNYTKGLSWDDAYHRLFSYMPEAGFSINGLEAYRINSNTYFTLDSSNGMTNRWVRISSRGCSNEMMGPLPASYFVMQFPFEVRVYVKNIPIDGTIIIPNSLLAGYSRVFQDNGTPDFLVPADKATIQLNLTTSIVHYKTSCKSNISNLNIDHKILDSSLFDSLETRIVTYQCENSGPIKIKLDLDYFSDGDPEKRLPLTSGNNTIYSELTLYDEQSHKKGKSFETTIDNIKNIRIESHLSGSDAEPGDYSGSAWLIASFL